jgi:bacterioferritin-associated ferredoxin
VTDQAPAGRPLVVCPCEGVTSAEIEQAIAAAGCQDVNEVKKITRAGMGPCQGVVCHRLVEIALARALGSAAAAAAHRFRPPVRPVPLGRVAALAAAMREPQGTVDAEVIWGLKAGARGTLPLDVPWRGAGD